EGRIFVGSNDQRVYAFAVAPMLPPPPPADAACPASWTCRDIGGPTPAGSESVSGTSWTIHAGGAGVGGTSDAFPLLAKTAAGDAQVTGRVTSLQNSGAGAQIGLMVRQSVDPSSPYFAVFATPNGGLTVRYRLTWGGMTTTARTLTSLPLPIYLQIQRLGDTLQAATSVNGVTYTLVPGTTQTIVLPASTLVGVAASSGVNGTAG